MHGIDYRNSESRCHSTGLTVTIPTPIQQHPLSAHPLPVLANAVRRVCLQWKLRAPALCMDMPDTRIMDINLCMQLSNSHPSWLPMLRCGCKSYAKAGMRLELVEYAVCRDAVGAIAKVLPHHVSSNQ